MDIPKRISTIMKKTGEDYIYNTILKRVFKMNEEQANRYSSILTFGIFAEIYMKAVVKINNDMIIKTALKECIEIIAPIFIYFQYNFVGKINIRYIEKTKKAFLLNKEVFLDIMKENICFKCKKPMFACECKQKLKIPNEFGLKDEFEQKLSISNIKKDGDGEVIVTKDICDFFEEEKPKSAKPKLSENEVHEIAISLSKTFKSNIAKIEELATKFINENPMISEEQLVKKLLQSKL